MLGGDENELVGAVTVAWEVDGVEEEWVEDDEPASALTASANTTSTTMPATSRRRMNVARSGGVRRRDTCAEEGELMASSEGPAGFRYPRPAEAITLPGDATGPTEKWQRAMTPAPTAAEPKVRGWLCTPRT